MSSRVSKLVLLKIFLVVALSCIALRMFCASFVYDNLADWISDSFSPGLLLLCLIVLLSFYGAFVVLREWTAGIMLFAVILFILCSPSILAFSQTRWFAFSGSEPSWHTSMTLPEMLAECMALLIVCLTIFYINWFSLIARDLINRGSERKQTAQISTEGRRFFSFIALMSVMSVIFITATSYGLKYGIKGFIKDAPIVTVFAGLGSCLSIIAIFYFLMERYGVVSEEDMEFRQGWSGTGSSNLTEGICEMVDKKLNLLPSSLKENNSFCAELTGLSLPSQTYKGNKQQLKVEHRQPGQSNGPGPETDVRRIVDKYYVQFNKLGWVQWVEWLDDSLCKKLNGSVPITKDENVVLCRSFETGSAPSIVRYPPAETAKKNRCNLSSMVATEQRLILEINSWRKKKFVEIDYKDVASIDASRSGSISLVAQNIRTDLLNLDNEVRDLLSAFLVVVCDKLSNKQLIK